MENPAISITCACKRIEHRVAAATCLVSVCMLRKRSAAGRKRKLWQGCYGGAAAKVYPAALRCSFFCAYIAWSARAMAMSGLSPDFKSKAP